MDILLGLALLYIPSVILHREGFPAENFTAQLSGQELCFSLRGQLRAALQIRNARHKGRLHTGRLTFGERATWRQQQEETDHRGPRAFCVLISLALWWLLVFYLKKAVLVFKASSLSKTSKQLYKAEGLKKATTANFYLGNRITSGRWET